MKKLLFILIISVVSCNLFHVAKNNTTYTVTSTGGDMTSLLNATVSALPANATLIIKGVCNISDKIILSKPIHIIGNGARLNKTTANGTAISIQSSNVSITGLQVNGLSDSFYAANADLITTEGSSEKLWYDSVKIDSCIIYNNTRGGIWLSYVTNYLITNNYVHNFPYQGIIVLSGKSGLISGNTVENISENGAPDSYGISVSAHLISSPENVSQNTLISNNSISNVPKWEGIDTHGGKNISFINNTITGAKTGIEIVPLLSDYVTISSQNILVTGNIIKGNPLVLSQGIRVAGLPNDLTVASVFDNQMTVGNIYFSNTQNSFIGSNSINQPNNAAGILAGGINKALSIQNNVVSDAYDLSGGGNTAAVEVLSNSSMAGNITGNVLKRTSFSGRWVNSYGFYQFSANNISFNNNDFSGAQLSQYKL